MFVDHFMKKIISQKKKIAPTVMPETDYLQHLLDSGLFQNVQMPVSITKEDNEIKNKLQFVIEKYERNTSES